MEFKTYLALPTRAASCALVGTILFFAMAVAATAQVRTSPTPFVRPVEGPPSYGLISLTILALAGFIVWVSIRIYRFVHRARRERDAKQVSEGSFHRGQRLRILAGTTSPGKKLEMKRILTSRSDTGNVWDISDVVLSDTGLMIFPYSSFMAMGPGMS